MLPAPGTNTLLRVLEVDAVSREAAAPSVWLYAIAPALLALAVSLNTLSNSFAFDDEWMILKNPFIHSLRNLPKVLTTNPWAITDEASVSGFPYFRPAFAGLLVVSYRLFGMEAWGYHLVNTLMHAAATLIGFFVILEITGRQRIAAICSLLFAVHPAHVEAVAWISGGPEPLMALFALSSFWLYLKYRKAGHKLLLAGALTLYLLALFSKETALALPLVVVCCELLWMNNVVWSRQRVMSALRLGGLFILPTAVYFLLRYQANGSLFLTYEPHFTLYNTVLSVPLAGLKYLALLLLPAGYRIYHYTEPVEAITSATFVVPVLILIALALAIRFVRSRLLNFSALWLAAWIALPLAAIAGFLPVYLVQERYLYLPSLGFCLAVALGIERLSARPRFGRFAAPVACCLLVVVWAAVSLRQNRVWHDSITLFEHNVASDDRSPQAHASLALEYFFRRSQSRADEEAQAAIELDPNCIDGYIALSYMAEQTDRRDEAIAHLERAISQVRERPTNRYVLASVHTKLGWLYAARKEFVRAEESLQRATTMVGDPQATFELGQFYFERERYEKALELFEKTSREVSPRTASVHLRLGRVYDRLGQSDKARTVFLRYLDLSPRGKAREEVISRLSQL